MNFNLTYVVAGVEVVFAIVGMAFGWLTPAAGSALILAGLGVFGARASQNSVGKVGRVW
jgi:hypothetical protein